MPTLRDVVEIGRQDGFLAVVSTVRPDMSIQSSVVNAGVLPHPITNAEVVAFVTYGKAKLTNLRVRPQTSVTFRAGWQWVAVEGRAELFGPDEEVTPIGAARLRVLLREIFTAAGSQHDDWDAYDRTMAEQHRTAVLVVPSRVYGN